MAEKTTIELPTGLPEWMRRQRWYTSKGSTPQLERRGGWRLVSGDATIETYFVLDRQSRGATLYQVPITRRDEPLEGCEPLWHDRDGYAYDAPHDPEYARAILALLDGESVVGDARGHRQPGARRVTISSSTVLKGEQSNTSIICAVDDGAPVILKIFRALHSGDNPDVVVQSAISAAGSRLVPTSLGYLSGEWPDGGEESGLARGHLAFAQDFLSGAEDGWRIALRAVSASEDFTDRARDLGRATALLHATLGEVLPTAETTSADIDRFVAGMRARAGEAIREIPELDAIRARIESIFDDAGRAEWPRLQRVHGDYHLGQVLFAPEANENHWIIIDFEGEPLRPMRERSATDIALRDVAGMVRSFDYAAAAVAHQSGGDPRASGSPSATERWAQAARLAFLEGYSQSSGRDVGAYQSLFNAFELDKALYEAIYEARNRPDWRSIPVAAIHRLTGS